MKIVRSWGKYTKLALAMIDIIIIALAYLLTQIFIQDSYIEVNQLLSKQMINSIVISIIIYEVFLHLFELYRTITVFESAKEYFCYALVCMISCNVVSI